MDWSWVGDIIGGVGSAATGGIFGLLGSGITTITKYFQSKAEHKQKLDLMEMTMRMKAQEGSWSSLIESMKADTSTSATYPWVNAIKSLYRPLLTSGLVFVTYLLFKDILGGLSSANSTLADIFTGTELKEIMKYIVYSVVFATSTAVVWWFADRAFAPPGLKNR